MRSIGKRNIQLVKNTMHLIFKEGIRLPELEQVTIDRLPSELWDTWEMADQEIRRIIHDEVMGIYLDKK